jgi:hypothetical protein
MVNCNIPTLSAAVPELFQAFHREVCLDKAMVGAPKKGEDPKKSKTTIKRCPGALVFPFFMVFGSDFRKPLFQTPGILRTFGLQTSNFLGLLESNNVDLQVSVRKPERGAFHGSTQIFRIQNQTHLHRQYEYGLPRMPFESNIGVIVVA